MPTKPPRSATRRSSSSVLLRGRSVSARQPVWLIETGACEMRAASRQVRSPLCDRSTMTRCAFSRSITSRPNGEMPRALRRHRAAADMVGAIVGELEDAHAEIGEDVDPVDVGRHHRRILEAVDDADPVLAPGAEDVGRARAP